MVSQGKSTAIDATTAPLPPKASGLPLLGNALAMSNDPTSFIVEQYHKLGSIFRIQILDREITVLAGRDANMFAMREGKNVFSNREVFIDLARTLGSELNLTALDGAAHKYLRSLSRSGYSRSRLDESMSDAIQVMKDFAEEVQPQETLDSFYTMQRLITYQLGRVATNYPADDYFDDLLTFQRYMMNVYLMKFWPRLALMRPEFKRVKARTLELGEKVVAYHIQNPPEGLRSPDLLDDLLQEHRTNPEKFPEEAVYAAAIGPYIAGQDTVASATAFLLYAILRDPQIKAAVQEEVDALFADGIPAAMEMRKADILHQVAIESLRLYPVTPFMPHFASQTFEYGGYRVEAGSEIYMAQTVTHFLPEYFEDPYTFKLDRPKPQPGTFTPFGVGAHTCLGAGMAEVLLMVNAAALLHYLDLAIDPPNYKLKTGVIPLPHPKGLGLKIIGKR